MRISRPDTRPARSPGATLGGAAGSLLTPLLLTACATTTSLPDPLAAGWNDEPVCERLHEDDANRILRCTFPPGVGHERHFHARHVGYAITGGRMRITDDEGTREVDVEDGFSFASDGIAWHEVLNIGDTTSQYLIIEPK